MKNYQLVIILFIISILSYGHEAMGMRNDLEKKISENLLLKSVEKDKFISNYKGSRVMSNREHFTRNLVSVSYRPYAQTINYTNDPINGNFDLSASSGMAATIEWSHNSFNRIQLLTGIDLSLMDYKEDSSLKANNLAFLSDKLFGFYAGLRYFMSDRWNIYTKFSLSQTHYVNFRKINNVSSPVLSRFTVPKIYLGIEAMLLRSENWKFALDTRALALTNLTKSLGTLEVSQGFGFYADLAIKYWMTNKNWFRLSFSMESLSTKLTGEGYTATQASSTPGIGAELGMRF